MFKTKPEIQIKTPLIFFCGVVIGFTLTVLIIQNNNESVPLMLLESKQLPVTQNPHVHSYENTDIAEKLQNEIRILCWIVFRSNINRGLKTVEKSWGQKCTKLLVFEINEDRQQAGEVINVRDNVVTISWNPTDDILNYIHEQANDIDWLLSIEPDVFVIMENLRFFLHQYSKNDLIYFEENIESNTQHSLITVISIETLNHLLADDTHSNCYSFERNYILGECLRNVTNVRNGNATDSMNRRLFISQQVEEFFIKNGLNALSDNAISFRYEAEKFKFMEYFTYHMSLYGVVRNIQELPKREDTSNKSIINSNAK